MRDFRVVPASTGYVVQCVVCGWYAPLWGRDPDVLHAEHVRRDWHPAEGAQKVPESPDPNQDTRTPVGASQIDAGAVRNGMPTGAGEPQ